MDVLSENLDCKQKSFSMDCNVSLYIFIEKIDNKLLLIKRQNHRNRAVTPHGSTHFLGDLSTGLIDRDCSKEWICK